MSWSTGEWGTGRGQLERSRGPGQARLPGVGTLLGRQPECREQSWRSSGLGPWGFSRFLKGRTKKRVRKEPASLTAAAVPPESWGLVTCVLTVVEQKRPPTPGPPPKPGRFPATALLGAVCSARRVEPCRGPEGPPWGSWEVWSKWEYPGQGGMPCGAEGKAPGVGCRVGVPAGAARPCRADRKLPQVDVCVGVWMDLPMPHSWAHLSPALGGAVLVLALSHRRGGMGVCQVHISHQALRGWQWS